MSTAKIGAIGESNKYFSDFLHVRHKNAATFITRVAAFLYFAACFGDARALRRRFSVRCGLSVGLRLVPAACLEEEVVGRRGVGAVVRSAQGLYSIIFCPPRMTMPRGAAVETRRPLRS